MMGPESLRAAIVFAPEQVRPQFEPNVGFEPFYDTEKAGLQVRNAVETVVSTVSKPEVFVPTVVAGCLAFQGDMSTTMDDLAKWSGLAVPIAGIGGALVGGIKHMAWRSQNLPEEAPAFSGAVIREAAEWGLAGGCLTSAAPFVCDLCFPR
ncbi:hypothetical protein ACFL2C_03920 [Patescibacteria group bacterium]